MKTVKQFKREAKRLCRFCVVDGLLDAERVRQVVQRVIDARRRGGLTLLAHFLHLVKLDSDRRTAQVETALPLPDDLRAGILTRLARTYGPGISVSFAEDPALIGGMRIKVGSDVYDGSVRAGLAELEKSF